MPELCFNIIYQMSLLDNLTGATSE